MSAPSEADAGRAGGASGDGRVVLAADVGGTNARFALVALPGPGGGRPRLVARARVDVAGSDGLEGPLAAFLAARGAAGDPEPAGACVAVAGTIVARAAVVAGVNLPWRIDAAALERACGLPRVELINDFHAAARGLEALGPGDAEPVGPDLSGRADAPVAILGAGTGLGEAFLLPPEPGAAGPGRRRVVPTEGGHRGFAPRTEQQDRLLRRLRREHGRVSTERVLSGPGLVALHAFLVEDEGLPRSPEVDAAPPAGRAPVISRRGLTGDDPACAAALALFVDIYGAEAGDLALSVVAAGGVWVAGGIAPDLLVVPAHAAAFRRAFEDKGRFAAFLREVPVRVVTSPDLGLLGAALESWPPTA